MSNATPRKRVKTNLPKGKSSSKRGSRKSKGHSTLYLLLTFGLAVGYLYFTHGAKRQEVAAEPLSTATETASTTTTTSSKSIVSASATATTADRKSKSTKSSKEKKSKKKAKTSALSDIDYEAENLPVLPSGVTSEVLRRQGYTLSYNAEFRQPNWVVYELLNSELDGDVSRKDDGIDFQPDPDLGDKSSQLKDYRSSGYDRGHIAPAADFSWDKTAMTETFYLSNMSPQLHDFNAGLWLYLENSVRSWARTDSAICIVAGPVLCDAGFPKKRVYLHDQQRVIVPQYFYKVILSPFGDEPKAIGFIIPYDAEGSSKKSKSKKSQELLAKYAVSVDSVEAFTGIDFFPQLPEDIERQVEAQCNPSDWGL